MCGLQYSGDIVDLAIVKRRLIESGLGDVASTEKFALFGFYRTLIGVPITLISALAASILPSISAAHSLRDRVSVEYKVNYALRFCFLVSVPSAIGLAVLNDGVFLLLFNENQGGYLLLYGAVVLILNAIVLIQTSILQSIGKLYASTLYIMLGVVGKIVTNYFLVGIPSINILGALFGNMVFFIIPLILNYRLINKTLKIEVSLMKHFKKPFTASALMGIVVYGAHSIIQLSLTTAVSDYLGNAISTTIAVIVGVFIYLYGLALTRGITQRDLEEFPSKVTKLIPKFIRRRII